MYQFYISTIKKKWSYNYLSKDFLLNFHIILKRKYIDISEKNKNIIAGALNLFLIIYFMADTGEAMLI